MKKQDQLVELIRAMTASEKRYFKLYCSLQKGEKFYLQLFDFIDRTAEPTNFRIQTKFKGHPQIHYLPRLKNYLFHLILRALRSFHEEKFAESQLHNRLNEIRILYDKGLWEIAYDLVNKGIELATTHHLHSIRLELYKWKSRLADSMYDLDLLQTVVEVDYPKAAKLRKEIDEYFQYLLIYDRFFYAYKRKGVNVDSNVLAELERVMAHPLMQDDAEPTYFYSRTLYFSVRSSYALIIPGKIHESIQYNLKLLNELQSNPEIIRESPKSYFAVMNNLLSRLGIVGDEKMFNERIKEYRKFPDLLTTDKRNVYKPRVVVNSLQVEIEFNYRIGKFEYAFQLWKSQEKEFFTLWDDTSVEIQMVVLLSGAKLSWACGQFKESNKLLNKILQNQGHEHLREDIWFSAFYLKVLNYFELKDQKGLSVAYKALERQYHDLGFTSPDPRIVEFIENHYKEMVNLELEPDQLTAEIDSWMQNVASVKELNTIKYYEPFYSWVFAKSRGLSMIDAITDFRKVQDRTEKQLK